MTFNIQPSLSVMYNIEITFALFMLSNGLRILNCLLSPYFVFRFSQTSLIHGNLRIILSYIPIVILLIDISQLLSQILVILDQQSELIWSAEQFTNGLYLFSFISCALATVLSMIERSFAVCKREDYEKRGNAIGIVLLTGNVSLILLQHFYLFPQ